MSATASGASRRLVDALLALIAALPGVAAAAPGSEFQAGAARIDITPDLTDLPAPFTTIHDRLFARAVVLYDGQQRAAIVIIDGSTFASNILSTLRLRIADEIHTPEASVILGTTHDHNAPRIDPDTRASAAQTIVPGSAKVAEITVPLVVSAVKDALVALRPARAGYAIGTTQLVARRARPSGTPPALDDALADRTEPNRDIGVLRIDDLSGAPIAFVFNSGLEPLISLVTRTDLGSDLAGATERYIERRYDDKAVAIDTGGPSANTPYNARRQGPQLPADPHAIVDAMGTILGEDVLATAAWIKPMKDLSIRGAFRILQCPGKITTPLNLPGQCSDAPGSDLPKCVFTTRESAPVRLEIGALRIGEVTFIQSDAGVAAGLWRKVAPAERVAFIETSYGPVHYIVADTDYPFNTYPATATTAKPGCAAKGFIGAARALIGETR